jgi:hypothetical protein
MPLITANFTQYVVYYIAGSSAAAGLPQDAEIDCFDSAGNRAGAIYFYPASSRMPKNQNTANGIYLYFRIARFSDVMTMLKYEKPLYLALDTANHAGYIGTSNEPAGEQEGP